MGRPTATQPTLRDKNYSTNVGRNQLLDELSDNERNYPRKITLNANGTYNVPAGYKIDSIVMRNLTANAVTGGIRIGTTAAGVDVVAAQAVGANALLQVADSALLKRAFSMTAVQQLFIEAVTAWNSANVEIYVKLSKLIN